MRLLRAMKELQVSVTLLALAVALTLAAAPWAQGQTFKTLYEFTGKADGGSPYAGVTAVVSGKKTIALYGTTYYGGNTNCNPPLGCGTVFKVIVGGKESPLYSFAGGNDGAFPYAAPIIDPVSKGLLYVTTSEGGGASGCYGSGCGTVVEVTTKGGKDKVLYSFTGGTDGGMPFTGLVADKKGNRFGTTTFGGDLNCGVAPPGCGTIFKIDPTGKVTIEYSFFGQKDGAFPLDGPLTADPLWKFVYVTTQKGGDLDDGEVDEYNNHKKELQPLHSFQGTDGEFPDSGVVFNNGFVYGTAALGGANGKGVVFKLELKTRNFTVLHSFGSGQDGATPIGGVTLDSKGNLYGTTEAGGQSGYGTLYKIDTKGNESVLHDFTFAADGGFPVGALNLFPKKCNCIFGTTSQSSAGSGTVWQYIIP